LVQLTDRDETILEWLRVVRMADLDANRWATGATSDDRRGDPVTLRNVQRRTHRMHEVGVEDSRSGASNAIAVRRFRPSCDGRDTRH